MKRPTRRQLLLSTGRVTAAVAGVCLYTWRVEPHWYKVVRRDLPVSNLPPALDGKTLAQVSDLHVGPQVDSDYLATALRHLSALEPDLVVVTGDFMTCRGAEQVDAVARVMENHDYGHEWSRPEAAQALTVRLGQLGVQVLRNERRDVKGLQLVGVDDLWGTNFRPADSLAGLTAKDPAVVLCHNPDAADRPVWEEFRGWILSGHTHGGQCKPPFLPPPLLPVMNKRYTAGEFDLEDGRRLYISTGLGHTLRVRFNVRPEVTLHRLVAV
jgi:uncharacterized protein